MAKSRLAEILKQEYKTKGVVGGAVSAVGKSIKEKMDFRNVLFGGSGIGSVVGRKIFGKGYSSTPESSVVSKMAAPEQTFSSEAVTVLSTIATYSATSAKNSIYLPTMARDMHLVKQNIAKLVRLSGGKPQVTAGDWLSRMMGKERAYEDSLKETKKPTPVAPKKQEDKKDDTMWSRITGAFTKELMSAIAPLKESFANILIPIKTAIESMLTSTVTGIARLLGATLTGPGFIGVLVAAAMAALYKSDDATKNRRWDELFEKQKNGKLSDAETKEFEELSKWKKEFHAKNEANNPQEIPDPTQAEEQNQSAQPPKPPSTTPSPVKTDGMSLLNKVMDKEGVTDPNVRGHITKIAMTESSMDPNAKGPTITSGMHKGDQARGLLQIMPKTATEVGFKTDDLNDPEKAATAGVRYFLKNLKKFNGNLDAATVAHHAGPGGAAKFLKTGLVGTRDVATGISTMDYLNKVSGSTLASASTSISDGQRQLTSAAPANVVVDNSVRTNNTSSPQPQQVASAYNPEMETLLGFVTGA
ncbi:MAG: lytic transglycosylase domain-containing protein [Sediminibacterium sp.]